MNAVYISTMHASWTAQWLYCKKERKMSMTVGTFGDHMLEIIAEGAKQDKMFLFLSERFELLLYEMNHPIAKAILGLTREFKMGYTVTFIDIDDTNKNRYDMVSYLASSKAIEIYRRLNGHDPDPNKGGLIWSFKRNVDAYMGSRLRSSVRIGRLVGKLFGNRFKPAGDLGNDIESFVNEYKAIISGGMDSIEEVRGEEIRKWYLYKNTVDNEGELSQSCMNYEGAQRFLDFYVDNPKVVSLLIMRDKQNKDKIRGRALVWKLSKPAGGTFMDRVYTSKEYEVDLFKRYARKQGWIYRKYESYTEEPDVVDSKTMKDSRARMMVSNVTAHMEQYFPYMDTMKFIDMDDLVMSSSFGLLDHHHLIYKLEGVNGNDYFVYDQETNRFERRIGFNAGYILDNIADFAVVFPNIFWGSINYETYLNHIVAILDEREQEKTEKHPSLEELIDRYKSRPAVEICEDVQGECINLTRDRAKSLISYIDPYKFARDVIATTSKLT